MQKYRPSERPVQHPKRRRPCGHPNSPRALLPGLSPDTSVNPQLGRTKYAVQPEEKRLKEVQRNLVYTSSIILVSPQNQIGPPWHSRKQVQDWHHPTVVASVHYILHTTCTSKGFLGHAELTTLHPFHFPAVSVSSVTLLTPRRLTLFQVSPHFSLLQLSNQPYLESYFNGAADAHRLFRLCGVNLFPKISLFTSNGQQTDISPRDLTRKRGDGVFVLLCVQLSFLLLKLPRTVHKGIR